MKRASILGVAFLMLAGWVPAETGNFNSFSTTVTETASGLDFDLLLTTTGATDPTASDWVYFFLFVGPAYQPPPTGTDCLDIIGDFTDYGDFTGDADYALRGLSGNQFSASFSFPGVVSQGTGFKWSAWAFYYYGDPDLSDYTTTLISMYSFLYYTVCPWLTGPTVTAGSFIFNIVDTAPESTGVWRQGIIIGSQQGHAIPTLGTWGLLVLGVLVAGAGLFILRRV